MKREAQALMEMSPKSVSCKCSVQWYVQVVCAVLAAFCSLPIPLPDTALISSLSAIPLNAIPLNAIPVDLSVVQLQQSGAHKLDLSYTPPKLLTDHVITEVDLVRSTLMETNSVFDAGASGFDANAAKELVDCLDTDKDGRVSYKEFIRCLPGSASLLVAQPVCLALCTPQSHSQSLALHL